MFQSDLIITSEVSELAGQLFLKDFTIPGQPVDPLLAPKKEHRFEPYFFQNEKVNKISTVKISSRPANINRQRNHLPTTGMLA